MRIHKVKQLPEVCERDSIYFVEREVVTEYDNISDVSDMYVTDVNGNPHIVSNVVVIETIANKLVSDAIADIDGGLTEQQVRQIAGTEPGPLIDSAYINCGTFA